MNIKEIKKRQGIIEKEKWESSREKGKDQCGSYKFCKYCNKRNKFPCGSAYVYMERKGNIDIERLLGDLEIDEIRYIKKEIERVINERVAGEETK